MTLAKYPGFCPKCRIRFRVGQDEIVKDTNGRGWIHKTCPERVRGFIRDSVIDFQKPSVNKPLPITYETNALADALFDAVAVAEVEVVAEKSKEFKPSKYQLDIFDFIKNGKGHAVVEAVAGSGKTTTIVKALDLTPIDAKVGFVAFNRHIAAELKKRAPSHVYVSTLHSLGLSVVRKQYPKVKIEEDKVGLILDDIWPVDKQSLKSGRITKSDRKDNFAKRLSMRKLVSISKSVLADYNDQNEMERIIERYGIEVDEEFLVEILEKLPEVMELCKGNNGDDIEMVDFDDMIWLPLVREMKLEQFDFLMVDEAQDMNVSQIKFILGSISPTGRIIAVGDRNQSLYGFRGADTDAIPNIIHALSATVLPLSVTYRCPKSHVEIAKQYVPQLEARDNAPDGRIEYIEYHNLASLAQPDDMVICRTNAPLVKPAFECIRQGKKAIIRGKDIGSSLINLIKRFETDDLGQFEVSLAEYFEHEYNKLLDKGKEMQALLLQDRVETLRFIMNEVSTVSELMAKIEMLFADSNSGVVFSSIHRAKGLEAENVYILRPDLLPHPKAKKDWETQQERNGIYVGYTRSKANLYFVNGGENV